MNVEFYVTVDGCMYKAVEKPVPRPQNGNIFCSQCELGELCEQDSRFTEVCHVLDNFRQIPDLGRGYVFVKEDGNAKNAG